jgi:penicillin-binding protein 1A
VASLVGPAPALSSPRGRPGSWLGIAAGLLSLLVLAGGAGLWVTTPSADDLQQRVAALTAAAGVRPLQPAEVPSLLGRAVVAVEDERFSLHHGLDTVGTARAAWNDLVRRCLCEGGSTLTQQLAKMVYFSDQGRIQRKLPGMAVALKIELRHTKPEILAYYLSIVPTGFGLTGARQAACAYFGRDLPQLSVAQAAEIAGMIQAPSAYDARYHPELARERRNQVLGRMVEAGYLTADQANAAASTPVVSGPGPAAASC